MSDNHLSFDQYSNLVSSIAGKANNSQKENFKVLVSDSYAFLNKYINKLPPLDRDLAKLYYIDQVSQDQIASILNWSQAAVSRRLKYIIERIKFLLRMPSLNPIQVREELKDIFPEELFEFAYFFYWEYAQNRVKFLIDTSQSGAANKFYNIIKHLEISKDVIISNQLIEEEQRKYCLIVIYLEYFQYIGMNSNVITYLYKKNDHLRANSLYVGNHICSES